MEKITGKSSEFLNKEKLYECFCELKNTPAGLDSILHDTVRYGIGTFNFLNQLNCLNQT